MGAMTEELIASSGEAAEKIPVYTSFDMVLIVSILATLSLLAVVGSVLQFLAVYLDKSLQHSSNIFILSLGCSDFIVGFWTMPTIAISVYNRDWVLSDGVCAFSAFLDSLAITASVWTLGFTALDRWMLVRSPISYKSQMQRTKALKIVALIYLIAFLGALPPLVGWSHYRFSPMSMSCAMGNYDDFSSVHTYYFLFYVMLTFPCPLALIITCYSCIAHFSVTRTKRGRQISPPNLRTAKITLLLTLFVLASILPTFVIGMIFWCGHVMDFDPTTSKIVIYTLLGNSAFNPLLYGWINSQFRRVYTRMACCVLTFTGYKSLKRSEFSASQMTRAGVPTLRIPVRSKSSTITPDLKKWVNASGRSDTRPLSEETMNMRNNPS